MPYALAMPSAFPAADLAALDGAVEVEIETTPATGPCHRTIIWVVVDGEEAFIRSYRGERARWYREALARPADVRLLVDGRRLPVRVEPAADERSVARTSEGLASKYAGDPSTPAMLRPEVLPTTLRLVPV